MLSTENRKDLIKYRIERAYAVLQEARDNAKMGHWNLTGNRLYYSVFHMCQALLLSEGETPRRHAGMIHKIGMDFITSGKLDKYYGRLISRLYELRQSGDYDEQYNATEEEVVPYFEQVEALLEAMNQIILNQLGQL
ncbi:MAG: HEPN domain-containing protein [Bacteroidaceae bacterium]|nr:HEPN domain-containing protein [Bacteroidaceae bacterium]